MAGADMRLDLDARQANAMFARLIANGSNLTPLMSEIGSELEASTLKRFADSVGPDGVAWVPLKPATLTRKKTKQILVENSDLMSSIHFEVGPTHVELIAGPAEYAAIHQFGGKPDMPPGPAGIPARPYLGLSEADLDGIDEAASSFLAEAARGP